MDGGARPYTLVAWERYIVQVARAPVLTALVYAAGLLPLSAAGASSEYVDATVCAGCHRQIAEDFARTGMGRSFDRATPAAFPEPPRDFYHAPSDTHYAIGIRDGQYYQRRWQIGFAGGETNVEELRIDYILGSGNHARSYLHWTARGTLIELPLGWYSDQSRVAGRAHWDMSPGSDSERPLTRRFVSYKCMSCHNGIPQIPAANEAPGSDPVFAGELPRGIDCQRCHGPGGRHLRTVTSRQSKLEDIRSSIVNPARIDSQRAIEICMQCHLETSSGRIPSSIVRFDRGPFSFVPGEPLDAFLMTFDHAPGTGHDDKFEAVNSVYRLRKSKCFRASEGRLTCTTCHNPHRAPRGAEATAHYAQVCRQCHPALAATHVASNDCAGCHMPKRRAEDTPGMVMTDHLIQRRPPPGDLVAAFRERPAEEYHGEVVPYYPAKADGLYRAVAQVGLKNNLEAGLPDLAREVAARNPAQAEFYVVLGDGWRNTGNPRNAVAAYREAARRAPDSARVLRLLAESLTADGQKAQGAETFQQAVAAAPGDPLTWYRYGLFDFAAGDLVGAAKKIVKAIELDPSLPDQSRSLGEVLASAGKPGPALDALRSALRTDPSDDAAWDLTGRVLAGKGDTAEAFYAFEKAVRLRPGSGTYSYDFALALARADRFEEAQKRAEAALKADPDNADAHELLGGLYARSGRLTDAARSYGRAVELRPDSARAHLRLGNVLVAQGDLAGAAAHFREAARSDDSTVAQQAAEALRRVGAAR
jgi:predicted CXXCH cytochrome family protein